MDPLYKEILIVLITIFIGLSIFGFLATRHFIKPQRQGLEDDHNDDEMYIVSDEPPLSTTSQDPSEWRVVIERLEVIENRLEQLEHQKAQRKVWGLALTILLPVIALGGPFLYISSMLSKKLP